MIRYISNRVKRQRIFESYEEDIVINLYYNNYDKTVTISHVIGYYVRNYDNKWIVKKYPNENNRMSDKVDSFHKFKITNFNREIIRNTFKKVKNKFRYLHEWVEFRDELTKMIFTPKEKCWDEVLPDKIAVWCANKLRILAEKNGDSCSDNFRVARVGNTCQERRYRRAYKRGCCGFFDCIEICPIDGKAYRLGFNYGH